MIYIFNVTWCVTEFVCFMHAWTVTAKDLMLSVWLATCACLLLTVDVCYYVQAGDGEERYVQYCTICLSYKAPRSHHCRKCQRWASALNCAVSINDQLFNLPYLWICLLQWNLACTFLILVTVATKRMHDFTPVHSMSAHCLRTN